MSKIQPDLHIVSPTTVSHAKNLEETCLIAIERAALQRSNSAIDYSNFSATIFSIQSKTCNTPIVVSNKPLFIPKGIDYLMAEKNLSRALELNHYVTGFYFLNEDLVHQHGIKTISIGEKANKLIIAYEISSKPNSYYIQHVAMPLGTTTADKVTLFKAAFNDFFKSHTINSTTSQLKQVNSVSK